jgi:hypothetical protein
MAYVERPPKLIDSADSLARWPTQDRRTALKLDKEHP